eukprot:CAMPEP_0119016446 /NCGR_PEP_ID=MMETSP1176-20130426/13061_1 /TAXON_ID=265551 /ORGANISM="Synedropsis recta cf, Strain CCMP1620" /LENGTH=341 /DNA_ID=CAMNT_0006969871 /DNA_START=139 /DNA_END=1161 /DNA_ORIENTATION=-
MDYAAKYQQYALQAAAAYKSYTMTEEDTTECAEFLMNLKHRSVTPEPQAEPQERLIVDAQTRFTPISEPSSPSQPEDQDQDQPKNVERIYDSSDEAPFSPPPALLDERGAIEAFWETLLGDTGMVCMADRDLVPDPLFVAMAQMKAVSLSEADRVGCYKSRPLGFTGMCCKHCGGQPGFGKYFPETVRSLAQTTTSQTILKHVGSKCRFCPPQVRQAVLELQRQQVIKETTNAGRPRYGSRKVFFQRIWTRLHGKNAPGSLKGMMMEENTPDHTPQHSDIDDDARSTDTASTTEDVLPSRKKQRFGFLPTKKNLMKRKMMGPSGTTIGGFEPPSKRSRFEW